MCFGFHFNIKKSASFIGILICLAGCAWQIYDITIDYLSNETITKRLLNPTVELPGMSICASKIYTTNHPRIQDDKGKVNLDLINNLKISEQFNHSHTYQAIIADCKIPTENNSFVDCSEVYTIREYLTLEDECILFFNQTMNRLPYKIFFRENRPILIRINRKVIKKRITFTVHSANTTFDHFNHNFIKISTHRYAKTAVSYSNINIESLPKPFKTQCTDYRQFEFKTKGNCIRQCLMEAYERNYRKWPPSVPVRDSNLLFATYQTDQQSDKQSNKTKKTQRTRCEEDCNYGTPCYQEMFEPLIISETEQLLNLHKMPTFDLTIIPPPYTIDFKYEIKTPMIHFLCYIASTVNLWLGVSAFPLLKMLAELKGKKSLKKDRKKESAKRSNSKFEPNNTIKFEPNNNLGNGMPTPTYIGDDRPNKPLTSFGFNEKDRY